MITVDHSDKYPYAYYDEWEGITSANNPEFWYALGMLKPNFPVPAIRYEVAYQIDDGDYWCGIYNATLWDVNPMHDDAFIMLWNVRSDPRRPLFWSPVF